MTESFTPDKAQLLVHKHLLLHRLSLLFVGMGIGKTAACLYALRTLFHECQLSSVLVVAPNRVANITWPEEVRDWKEFRWMRVANLRTPEGKKAFLGHNQADIFLINYESLHVLTKLVKQRGGTIPYDLVIFDELTKAKNPNSKRINRFRRLVPQTEYRWGLTGTPMPNSELDLFAQVRLIDDGKRLGSVYMQYKERFFEKEDWHGYKWRIKEGASNTIEGRISDITLTLRSADWVDIPEPVVVDVPVAFDADLTKAYLTFEKELVMELRNGGLITATNAAALVSKLLQFTSGASYDAERKVHRIHNLKLKALKQLQKDHKGKPLLVAVNFQHEQARIRRHFPEAEFFADATTESQQRELKRRWNAGEIQMLVAHPKSVGHGLNLQYGGHIIVWFTLTYSREDYEQMICRLARRGQKEIVLIYRLIVPKSIDEVVAGVVESKAANEAKLLNALTMLESMRD
jgi:hypothetical protein